MRYAKLSCTEFYPCYLQQCHSIDLFSYRTHGHGQNCHMNKACPFRGFHGIGLLVFFRKLNMVLGTHVVLCMTKKMFYPQNGENRPSPGFFECIGKFSFFSQFFTFFINSVYNESLQYCNCCMLLQISYLGKFWFLRYGPKFSWPIRITGFFNQLQDFKIGCFSQRS